MSDETVAAEIVDKSADPPSPEDLDIDLPDEPEEAIATLTAEVARARSDAAGHLDDLQRLAAEFENFRKRIERDRAEVMERSTEDLVARLLPVLDSFDQAFTHEPRTEHEDSLVRGMRSVYHQFMDVLSAEGLEVIAAEGEAFDPSLHEAVSGGGEGDLEVSNEMRRGYILKGRVLRPALVAVAGADGEEDEGE